MTFALAVVGGAGSGKSTVAQRIALRTAAVYLDKDSLAGPLVEAALAAQGQSPDDRESNSFYIEHVMPAEYRALFSVAGDNLRLGRSVVIDAPFAAYLDQPEFFTRAASDSGWPTLPRQVLQVFTSETTTRRRLAERGLPRDHAKLNDWNAFWPTWGDLSISWTGVRLHRLNNDLIPDIDAVVARLEG
ncbi:putative kinase [Conyzicola nivalis]|uniref:Kinase n=1 Tax=Conyzicola nivalis TaxID=1477021 RepID=A0ABV2QLU4_9MICO